MAVELGMGQRTHTRWDLSPKRKEAAARTILSLGKYDVHTFATVVRQLPDSIHALKVDASYLLEEGIRMARFRKVSGYTGRLYFDLALDISPTPLGEMVSSIKRNVHDNKAKPSYVALPATATDAALHKAVETAGDDGTVKIVLSSVSSTTTDADCLRKYKLPRGEAVREHVELARKFGIGTIAGSAIDMQTVELETIGSGFSVGGRPRGDHVVTTTYAHGSQMVDIMMFGSAIMGPSIEPQVALNHALGHIQPRVR